MQRAALERQLFLFAGDKQRTNRFEIEITQNNQTIHVPMNYRAKVADASGRQGRALRFHGKNHPRLKAAVFFPKTLPAGSIRFYRPIVQRDM